MICGDCGEKLRREPCPTCERLRREARRTGTVEPLRDVLKRVFAALHAEGNPPHAMTGRG